MAFAIPGRSASIGRPGDLWAGDVGWELWELADRVVRGGNYGWSVTEGLQPVYPDAPRGPTPILPPTIAVPHTDGASITGGYVYRGKRLPELVGTYVFGDWESRRIGARGSRGAKWRPMPRCRPPGPRDRRVRRRPGRRTADPGFRSRHDPRADPQPPHR